MDVYALWNEVFPLKDLPNIQFFIYWIALKVATVKNNNMLNFENYIPKDQTIKTKSVFKYLESGIQFDNKQQ